MSLQLSMSLIIVSHRVTVAVNDETGSQIVGTGDHPSRKEAEKLAALCALYQLDAKGLVCIPHRAYTFCVLIVWPSIAARFLTQTKGIGQQVLTF